mgnify:CR=1 FL=1
MLAVLSCGTFSRAAAVRTLRSSLNIASKLRRISLLAALFCIFLEQLQLFNLCCIVRCGSSFHVVKRRIFRSYQFSCLAMRSNSEICQTVHMLTRTSFCSSPATKFIFICLKWAHTKVSFWASCEMTERTNFQLIQSCKNCALISNGWFDYLKVVW